MITYPCPHCGERLQADDGEAGHAHACEMCGKSSHVPALPAGLYPEQVYRGRVVLPSHVMALTLAGLALIAVVALLEFLVLTGGSLNGKDKDGETALHRAIGKGQIGAVRVLLALGADVNGKSKGGATPLMCAMEEGYAGEAELLLAKGADVNIKDSRDATALHRAAEVGDVSDIKLLLDKGAQVNARDVAGHTPLDVAKSAGNDSPAWAEAIDALRAHGGVE
jgi:ankyrin repeat protein